MITIAEIGKIIEKLNLKNMKWNKIKIKNNKKPKLLFDVRNFFIYIFYNTLGYLKSKYTYRIK